MSALNYIFLLLCIHSFNSIYSKESDNRLKRINNTRADSHIPTKMDKIRLANIKLKIVSQKNTAVTSKTDFSESPFSNWSSWSRCEDCFQLRMKSCLLPTCHVSRIYEERPCDKARCKRKARQKEKFHIVHLNEENRRMKKQSSSKIWSRWSEWSPCSQECRTQRYRLCRKPGRCKKKRQTQNAYCYHERSRCEYYVLSDVLEPSRGKSDVDRYGRYHYSNNDTEDSPPIRWTQKKCGRPHRKTKMLKIIGGVESRKYKWPWHVAVINIYMEVFCAGTLIAPRWVLTAGHCIRSYLRVRLNEHDLRARDGREIEMVIHKMFLHPKFNHQTVDNDIALLRLPRGVKLPVACLPSRQPQAGELCNVMGWGKIKSSDVYGARVLYEAMIPVVSGDRCSKSYKQFLLTTNMFCAGWISGAADTCAGDSGGGLICQIQQQKSKHAYTVQGITSFGDGCGRKNKFGIYTTVYNYKNWIGYIIEHYS